jgi:hypothetical protein
MKKVFIAFILATITIFCFSQTTTVKKESKSRHFLFVVQFSTLEGNGFASSQITTDGSFPNYTTIEDNVCKKFKVKADQLVLINIFEFKSEQDWKDYNYSTWVKE